MSGTLTVGNINVSSGGAINTLSSVKLLQLRRLLDFYQFCPGGLGSIGRQFMLCSPTYPCVGVCGWMNSGNPAYALLRAGNHPNFNNSIDISDGNYDGKIYTGGLNDKLGLVLLYPGYGFKGWTYYDYVNDGNGNSNKPAKFENTTGDIQWYNLEYGVGSINNNVQTYGINLNQGAPRINEGGWNYWGAISSAQVYAL